MTPVTVNQKRQSKQGRQLTAKAYQHFGKRKDQDLFG